MEKQSKIREILCSFACYGGNKDLCSKTARDNGCDSLIKAESQILGLIGNLVPKCPIGNDDIYNGTEEAYIEGFNDCIDEMNEKIKGIK